MPYKEQRLLDAVIGIANAFITIGYTAVRLDGFCAAISEGTCKRKDDRDEREDKFEQTEKGIEVFNADTTSLD